MKVVYHHLIKLFFTVEFNMNLDIFNIKNTNNDKQFKKLKNETMYKITAIFRLEKSS